MRSAERYPAKARSPISQNYYRTVDRVTASIGGRLLDRPQETQPIEPTEAVFHTHVSQGTVPRSVAIINSLSGNGAALLTRQVIRTAVEPRHFYALCSSSVRAAYRHGCLRERVFGSPHPPIATWREVGDCVCLPYAKGKAQAGGELRPHGLAKLLLFTFYPPHDQFLTLFNFCDNIT